jgi:hypothetical protein
MALFLSIYVFGIIGFFIHLFLDKQPRTKERVIELFLLYQIVFSLGLTSFMAFIGLTFMKEYVAIYSGWTPSTFEQLLANVNLSFGVLGILSIWFRGYFWMATILGFSIWILSDGVTHLIDMVANNNYAEGNIGVPLWTDIAVPIILLIFLAIYLKQRSSVGALCAHNE